MNKGFCVIEGVCNAGKTTLLSSLKSDGFFVVPETGKMASNFPPPPTNFLEARINEKFILDLEIKRAELGKKSSLTKLSFADRALPSVIAITYGYCLKRGYNTLDGLFDDIINIVKKNPYAFHVDYYVYLKITYDTVSRRNTKKKLSDFWVNKDVINAQINFYDLYQTIMKSQTFITIEADNMNKEELKDKILSLKFKQNSFDKETLIAEYKQLHSELTKYYHSSKGCS
ncbi:hypothetical protein [Alkaliphilus serpentinus]|uniref:Thymidylate kinase n=1 Tax=Alkaliphilus serpentinus TaxID=1482731 RepID=A0A833MDY2_9FIRM|nr:hypothetical protein [Alkaliphilus serpentinus]KAB3529849.1 hypothetical protein F8153_08605 [Alkaliphilus serpentinus]